MTLPPIFFVCGVPGSGKTTLAHLVSERLPQCFVLDTDWLIDPLIKLSERNLYEDAAPWPALGDVWLAIAWTNALARRSSVVFSPAEPHEIEGLPMRTRLGQSHWLLLDCDDDHLRARLQSRGWAAEKVRDALSDAERLRSSDLEVLRTDEMAPAGAADAITSWVRERL